MLRSACLALVFWLLAFLALSCSEREDWQSWPRRGTVPLASDDCMVDSCLEYREQILIEKLEVER